MKPTKTAASSRFRPVVSSYPLETPPRITIRLLSLAPFGPKPKRYVQSRAGDELGHRKNRAPGLPSRQDRHLGGPGQGAR